MFYIRHPKCQVPLHIVEDCVITRLQYLKLLYEDRTNDFDGKFEYLFEDSIYDSVGHFTLRLIGSTSEELRYYWLIRERKLLRHRLEHLLPRQIHRLFRKILRNVKITYDLTDIMYIGNALITFTEYFLKPEVFTHIVEKQHDNNCELYNCKINFQSVPDLIKDRRINLINGYAIVKCSMWKIVLESLFNTLIQHEYKYSGFGMREIVKVDPRLNLIYEKIKRQILNEKNDIGIVITTGNIDDESNNFPLCMQHLYHILYNKHRLSHYARFYYSLFLKECGMNIESAINYWKNEYSKPHMCSSCCTHDWQTSKTKFLYGIRHLYGLEGKRKNYKAPNCQMICTRVPGPRYEGGCPFKNFETTALENLLDNWNITNDEKEKLIKIGKDKPQIACGLFQKIVKKSNDDIVINSPVQYYSNIIKLSNQR